MSQSNLPYWKRKTLAEMSSPEWEALCDGCGQCCRHKLEDSDTSGVYPTRVACQLLDTHSCRCTDYTNRHMRVPDCIELTVEKVAQYQWLPDTCAYRRLARGEGLAWWHPLVSGDPETVHTARISVQGQLTSEQDLLPGYELEDYMEESEEWT